MFHIQFYVDDEHLAFALKSIDSVAHNINVRHMKGKMANGSIPGTTPGTTPGRSMRVPMRVPIRGKDANSVALLVSFLNAIEGTIDTKVIKSVVKKIGWSPTSYMHFVNKAVSAGALKRGPNVGSRHTYLVV